MLSFVCPIVAQRIDANRLYGENLQTGWSPPRAGDFSPVYLISLRQNIVNIWTDERLRGPLTVNVPRIDPAKPNPKSGAAQLEWNKTGTLLLVRFGKSLFNGFLKPPQQPTENVPTLLHIYDFPTPSQPFVPRLRCVLQHQKPVLNARWNPMRKGSLAICCGTQSIYTWSDEWVGEIGDEEEMAECIGVPASSK